MQPRPQKRTRMAERLDRLGLSVLLFAGCFALFLFLWDAFLPSLAAGTALSILALVPLLRMKDKRHEQKKERASKRLVAEEKVNALLFVAPEDAAFQASQWLATACALRDLRRENGFCTAFHEKQKVAVFFLQKHPCGKIDCDDLLPCVRAAMQCGAEICAVCAPCSFSEDALQNSGRFSANQPSLSLFDQQKTVRFCMANLTEEELASRQAKARCSPFHGQSQKKRLWHEFRVKALCRRKCPRYALLTLAFALGFRQGGHPLNLLCAASCALLLLLSLFSPFARKQNGFFTGNT